MKTGNITLLIGPSFAGKTTELIRQINRHKVMQKKICLILPEEKHKEQSKFNFLKGQIIHTSLLCDVLRNSIFEDADIIAIDDLHYFLDVLYVVPLMADKFNKKIICAGLDNNSERELYGNVVELIPKCEYVEKLTAFCSDTCDTSPAIFTKKINGKFQAVSRKAYLNVSETGFLHIITGPMFSGKTTELIRMAKQYQSINKRILAINYSRDTRYDNEANIFSHDKQKFESTLPLETLDGLLNNPKINENDVILIDEVQFFKNSFDIIKSLVEEHKKIVIVSGLDGDYLQNPFGDICRLIAFADKLTRLNAICCLSSDYPDASFSRRIAKSKETEFIGSEDSYMAVSRAIYNLPYDEFIGKLKKEKSLE